MTVTTTELETKTCDTCGVEKDISGFGGVSGGRQHRTTCRQCVREAVTRKRRERSRESDRPDEWYAENDDATFACERCQKIKGEGEYARNPLGGGGRSRWRRRICKACVRERRRPAAPVMQVREGGRVRELWYCADCAAEGIISPVPAGRRCPWHGYHLPVVPGTAK